MARTTLHAIAATTAPLGLAAQLVLAAGGPALAQQQRLNGITPAMAGAVLSAKAATRPQLIQIRPEALRSLSNRLRAGQPVAANELDAYKEFCTEQVSQANVHETSQERRGSHQASNSQHVDRSKRWDTSFNRDGRYANSAKGEVSLFGGGGKVSSDISRNNNGTNRGAQTNLNKTSTTGKSSWVNNAASYSDHSRESAQDCAAVLEHLTAKEQTKTDLAKAKIEAESRDRETAANERIRMAELAAQKELAQMQAQLVHQQGQAQQTQGWMQLGMGLLSNMMQPRQQAVAPQPDLVQLQQLILDQQAQIKALQQQQLPQTTQATAVQ